MAVESKDFKPAFKPALIVVDFQNDFCPPNGALAVPTGDAIAPTINTLLRLPFTLRIATKDHHPPSHVSFATNHPAPNNIPFTSTTTIPNPRNPSETQTTLLWPPHCIQDTTGAEFHPALDTSLLDEVVLKGQDERVETYSAFGAPFRDPPVEEARTGLAELLRGKGVSHVFVVGLALDYCVKCTAVDAVAEGFETVVVREATRGVDGSVEGVRRTEEELRAKGVGVVGIDGAEIGRVRALTLS